MKSSLILSLVTIVVLAAAAHLPLLKPAALARSSATEPAADAAWSAIWGSLDGPYEPVARSLMWVERRAGAGAVVWTSVALHAAMAVAVYLLLRKLKVGAALLAAALLAVHPLFNAFLMTPEAQPTLLACALMTAALWAYARAVAEATRVREGSYLLCLLLLAVALLSDPVACLFPLLLFVLPQRPRAGLLLPVLVLSMIAAWLLLDAPQQTPEATLGITPVLTLMGKSFLGWAQKLNLGTLSSYWLLPLYILTTGILVALAAGAGRLTALLEKEDRWIAAAAAVPLVAVLGFLSFQQAAPDGAAAEVAAPSAVATTQIAEAEFQAQVRAFKQMIEKDSGNAGAYVGLSNLYIKRGQLKAAMEVLDTGVSGNWDSGVLHSNMATASLLSGDVDNAALHAKEALRIDPNDAEAHHTMGDLKRDEHLDEAIGHYTRALARKPGDAGIIHSWGIALMLHGMLDEAESKFREALRRQPDMAAAHNNLGYLMQLRKHWPEALAEYRLALRLNPNDPGMHYNMAEVLAAQHQQLAAIEQYRIALAARRNWPDAEAKLAFLLATADDGRWRDLKEAQYLADRACWETRRKDAVTLEVLAAVQAQAGEFAQAAQTGQEAIAVASAGGEADLANDLRDHVNYYRVQAAARAAPQTFPYKGPTR